MLKSLSIQNYALISSLEIDFSDGFSVITGETGAGKSIILGALALILGSRADSKVIKQDEKKCVIEGLFQITGCPLAPFFAERELDYDEETCLIRREVHASGKSRAFINDTPVSLVDIKELTGRLIDIHSQHQNLLLTNNSFQLEVVDTLSDNDILRKDYSLAYDDYTSKLKALTDLQALAGKQQQDEDYLRFQFAQLDEAALQEGEQEQLEAEAATLSNMEEIKRSLYTIQNLLDNDNGGVVNSLKDGRNTAQSLSRIYPQAREIEERLDSAFIELKDLLQEVSSLQEELELDPERLQWVTDRLDVIYSLQQKHKLSTVDELIALRNDLDEQLQAIDNFDNELERMEQEVAESYRQLKTAADQLTVSRQKGANRLSNELISIVSPLGMPYMQFECRMEQSKEPMASGQDVVTFFFTANKNSALQPVAQIASGGEISRLMLGLKALTAGAKALPTIIFDEIDTGVSGEIADRMGEIMKAMGRSIQVITITHLPQIAVKGKEHFFVYKDNDSDRTETHIRCLTDEERIQEIAQMLSGSVLTEAALDNARELLKANNN